MNFDYYYWNSVLNIKEITDVLNIVKTNTKTEYKDKVTGALSAKQKGEELPTKTSKVSCLKWNHLNKILCDVYENWMAANKFHFGYSLFPLLNTEIVNFNEYDSVNNGQYDLHIDATNNSAYDIKLTGMINLSNEEYEGGEFRMFTDGKFRHIKEFDRAGSSMIFKSHIPHQVTPVTKGIRKTLSIWLTGSKFI